MTDADRALIDAYLRERSHRAFAALYERHTAGMYALALRLSGGRNADAEDAVQDAWVRALSRIGTFRGESTLRTWLCGITVNCSRERLRHPLFLFPEALEDVAQAGSDVTTTLTVEQALAGLPPGYRAVLVLHDLEGYTHVEIAGLLGIEPGTSKSQLARARRALRIRLGPEVRNAG